MYCLKCRRVTEPENIATATSRNGRIMRRGQCITWEKNKTQSVKKAQLVDVFLILCEQTLFRNEFARTYLYWPGNKTL